MGQRKDFSRIKIEEVTDRQSAISALSVLAEDTYRRTKGKTLSILESLGLDQNSEELHKKMLIGYLKSIANSQADIIYAILENLLEEDEKDKYIKRFKKTEKPDD